MQTAIAISVSAVEEQKPFFRSCWCIATAKQKSNGSLHTNHGTKPAHIGPPVGVA